MRSRFGLLAIDEVESEIGTCDMWSAYSKRITFCPVAFLLVPL